MIDYQIHGNQWLDVFWILAHFLCNATHGSEVSEQGDTGEVLQHNAGDYEGDFIRTRCIGLPIGELAYVRFGDLFAVAVAQHRFEHDADRYGQSIDILSQRFLQGGQ